MCVEAVLSGEGSVNDITAKYNISSRSVLRGWILRYNADIELKDYDPKIVSQMGNQGASGEGVNQVCEWICNEFVVGYGLDFRQQYRNLPYIGVLKPEIYQN